MISCVVSSTDAAATREREQVTATGGSIDLFQEHPLRRLSKHCHLVGLASPCFVIPSQVTHCEDFIDARLEAGQLGLAPRLDGIQSKLT